MNANLPELIKCVRQFPHAEVVAIYEYGSVVTGRRKSRIKPQDHDFLALVSNDWFSKRLEEIKTRGENDPLDHPEQHLWDHVNRLLLFHLEDEVRRKTTEWNGRWVINNRKVHIQLDTVSGNFRMPDGRTLSEEARETGRKIWP